MKCILTDTFDDGPFLESKHAKTQGCGGREMDSEPYEGTSDHPAELDNVVMIEVSSEYQQKRQHLKNEAPLQTCRQA